MVEGNKMVIDGEKVIDNLTRQMAAILKENAILAAQVEKLQEELQKQKEG